MAGYFSLGENKIRPGAYFNVQKRGDETNFGAIDGVVAVLFKSSIGPLGKATVLPAAEGYENTFGTGGTTDALREAFYGGAVKLIAVRVGNGGTVGSTITVLFLPETQNIQNHFVIPAEAIEKGMWTIRYSSDGMETVNVYEGSVEDGSESVAV